jgi:hypothetical protein
VAVATTEAGDGETTVTWVLHAANRPTAVARRRAALIITE